MILKFQFLGSLQKSRFNQRIDKNKILPDALLTCPKWIASPFTINDSKADTSFVLKKLMFYYLFFLKLLIFKDPLILNSEQTYNKPQNLHITIILNNMFHLTFFSIMCPVDLPMTESNTSFE